jgi:hypothetical protein
MTTPEYDRREEYEAYAEYCLNVAQQLADQESRRIHREMAAEWLRLAEAIQSPTESENRKAG